MLASLGKVLRHVQFFYCDNTENLRPELLQDPTDEYLDAMMSEAPGPINFTMFLTLFGERLQVCPFSAHG